jgi:hypothetical protein
MRLGLRLVNASVMNFSTSCGQTIEFPVCVFWYVAALFSRSVFIVVASFLAEFFGLRLKNAALGYLYRWDRKYLILSPPRE